MQTIEPAAAKAAPRSRAPRNLRPEQLLSAIEKWLGSAGAVNFSLRAAAKAAGVSSTTLLNHFGSREGLLVAIYRHHTHSRMDLLKQAVEQFGSFSRTIDLAMEQPVLIELTYARFWLQVMAIGPTINRESRSEILDWHASEITELAGLIATDGLDPSVAAQLAEFMSAAISGFIQRFAATGNETTLQNNYRHLYRCLLSEIDRHTKGDVA